MASIPSSVYVKKGSFSLTQNTNNASPLSLPSLTKLNGGQIQSTVGNSDSIIGGFVGNNAGGMINVLDGGAIDKSFDFGKTALKFADDFADDALLSIFNLTSKTIQQNSNNTAEFLNQVKSASDDALGFVNKVVDEAGANNGLLKNVLIGGGALIGLFLVLKFSKLGK